MYTFMTRPKMRVLRAGGTRLAPTETECRKSWAYAPRYPNLGQNRERATHETIRPASATRNINSRCHENTGVKIISSKL